MKKWMKMIGICTVAAATLVGCGAKEDKTANFRVGMVTSIGGVDDKSFNQSAWEGLQQFGKANGLKQGLNGYHYLQSNSDADYSPNLNTLVRKKFDVVYGIGFFMQKAVNDIAEQQPKQKFAIVDEIVKQPNVASIVFKENESAFLAGVVAGLTTKTNKIGFIGGDAIPVVKRFEQGFHEGVAAVNPTVKVENIYLGSFMDANKGKTAAAKMYMSGIDVIAHAAGGSGNGIFSEAKERQAKQADKRFFVIGADRDQSDQGEVTVNGKKMNVTLTSMLKHVNVAVADIAEKAKANKFPAGEVVSYGVKENGVGIVENDNISAATMKVVNEWKVKMSK